MHCTSQDCHLLSFPSTTKPARTDLETKTEGLGAWDAPCHAFPTPASCADCSCADSSFVALLSNQAQRDSFNII